MAARRAVQAAERRRRERHERDSRQERPTCARVFAICAPQSITSKSSFIRFLQVFDSIKPFFASLTIILIECRATNQLLNSGNAPKQGQSYVSPNH